MVMVQFEFTAKTLAAKQREGSPLADTCVLASLRSTGLNIQLYHSFLCIHACIAKLFSNLA